MFRFNLNPWTLSRIHKEFEWLLKWNEGEILEDVAEEAFIARFNLARLIFLERGL
jgi:hypothetical protein